MVSLVARRSALAGLAAFLAALLLFFVVGAVRFWPRIADQHLPPSLIWPFARPLLAAALELAFLVSVPIAAGSVLSLRALRTPSGMRWQTTAYATLVLVLGLGALGFGASSWLDGRGSSPGQLATELVESARQSCVESAAGAQVTVPMLGFVWTCDAGHAPQLKGRAPLGKEATFRAAAIELGGDLKRIAFDQFTLAFPLTTFQLQVEVHAKQATVSGLPPWGRSRRMPLGLRMCLFALSATIAGFGIGRLVSLRGRLPWWAGALFGAFASSALWWAMTWMERQEPRLSAYLAMPAAAAVATIFGALCLAGLERLCGFRDRTRGNPRIG